MSIMSTNATFRFSTTMTIGSNPPLAGMAVFVRRNGHEMVVGHTIKVSGEGDKRLVEYCIDASCLEDATTLDKYAFIKWTLASGAPQGQYLRYAGACQPIAAAAPMSYTTTTAAKRSTEKGVLIVIAEDQPEAKAKQAHVDAVMAPTSSVPPPPPVGSDTTDEEQMVRISCEVPLDHVTSPPSRLVGRQIFKRDVVPARIVGRVLAAGETKNNKVFVCYEVTENGANAPAELLTIEWSEGDVMHRVGLGGPSSVREKHITVSGNAPKEALPLLPISNAEQVDAAMERPVGVHTANEMAGIIIKRDDEQKMKDFMTKDGMKEVEDPVALRGPAQGIPTLAELRMDTCKVQRLRIESTLAAALKAWGERTEEGTKGAPYHVVIPVGGCIQSVIYDCKKKFEDAGYLAWADRRVPGYENGCLVVAWNHMDGVADQDTDAEALVRRDNMQDPSVTAEERAKGVAFFSCFNSFIFGAMVDEQATPEIQTVSDKPVYTTTGQMQCEECKQVGWTNRTFTLQADGKWECVHGFTCAACKEKTKKLVVEQANPMSVTAIARRTRSCLLRGNEHM